MAGFKSLAIVAITIMGVGSAFADDNQDQNGLWLYTTYLGLNPANRCSVVAYIRDITSTEPARRYTVGYTGPGGLTDYPPHYNRCIFRQSGGYYIPCDSRYRWRFYAKRQDQLTQQWYYSDWSKEMEYSPQHPFDSDTLNIHRTSPPDPIPPYYTQE